MTRLIFSIHHVELRYFDSSTLSLIEQMTRADSILTPKDRDLLTGLMSHLNSKSFLTRSQKYNVIRIVDQYKIAFEPR